MNNKINILTPSKGKMEITPKQGVLDLGIERERDVEGIGMGVLSDGTPYLSQRGLASLCGVQNAHIGTISSQWDDEVQKPRITTIKGILSEAGSSASRPHVEVFHKGVVHFCYPLDALGEYRRWLQTEYLGGGKFKDYLAGKRELPPSVAQLAIERLTPKLIGR